MFTRRILSMAVVASLFMAGALMAADATGSWQYAQPAFGGRRGGGGGGGGGGATPPAASQPAPMVTMKLKQDGEKLTGTVLYPPFGGRGRRGGGGGDGAAPPATPPAPTPIDIKDGKVSGSDVSFSVTRTFGAPGQGAEITTKYTLKLDADTLKGKTEADFNGNPISQDIEAKRVKDEAAK